MEVIPFQMSYFIAPCIDMELFNKHYVFWYLCIWYGWVYCRTDPSDKSHRTKLLGQTPAAKHPCDKTRRKKVLWTEPPRTKPLEQSPVKYTLGQSPTTRPLGQNPLGRKPLEENHYDKALRDTTSNTNTQPQNPWENAISTRPYRTKPIGQDL